jgi:Domain of unknown function (DUF4340)
MMRKYLNTLVAIVVLAALWGGFYFYGKHKAKEKPPSESKQEKLLPLNSSHIESFTLTPRDGEPLTCALEKGQWAIVKPRALPADQAEVNSFLSTLTDATIDDVVNPHPTDLAPFGLDQPAETLDVSTNSKPASFVLKLGDETPTSGGIYAQVAGNPRVVKLASYLESSLEKKLFDLRDKRAVTIDFDQLKRLEVVSKKNSYTLVKNPEGVWDLVLPPAVRADHFAVDGLVNQLRNLSMKSIVSEDKTNSGKYGFIAPTLTVALTGPEVSQTLALGRQDEKDGGSYYAENSALSPVFTLNSSLLTQLDKQPADLRDKDLFSFSSLDAKNLRIETPGGRRVLALQKDKWKQTAPSAKDVSRDKMDDLLGDLRDLRAESFPKGLTLAAAGLNHPAYRFEVEFGDKNQKEIVEVSKVKDHLYARRSTDPLPSELSKDALDSIQKALKNLPQ